MRTLALAVLVSLATLSAAPASARVWNQDWAVTGRPVIHIETNDAHVSVHHGPAGHVLAMVEYKVDVWGWHSTIQAPSVTFDHRDGAPYVITARSHANVTVFGGINERFHVDVTVPADCDVQVRSDDGAVDVEAINGSLDAQTGDGHIHASGIHGHARLYTGDGAIEADGLDGVLDAHTHDGHVKVAGRFDELRVHTGDGHVTAEMAEGSAPRSEWLIETGDGGVDVLVPRDFKALVDASTGDGHVRIALPITGWEGKSLHEWRGALNGGTVPVRVHTGDGGIQFALSH